MRLRTDTRGASIALTHALALGITAVLISGLVVSASGFLDHQNERAAQEQLTDVAGDVVEKLNGLDGLADTGEDVTASIELTYSQEVGGEPYTLELDASGGSSGTLRVHSSALERPITQPVDTDVALVDSRARGQAPTLSLCEDELRLGECP